MKIQLNQFVSLLKKDLGLLLSICFGVFLFVLFFQPFQLDKFDFNNRLLFVLGLSAIVFIFMVFVRITFPWLLQKYEQEGQEPVLPAYMSGFILMALSSVAFAFYLHYVGSVPISFFIMSKIVLICLAPPLSLKLYDTIYDLKQQNESLINEKKIIQNQVEKYEEDYLNKSIEFISENSVENLNLSIADVAIIKSADNYVEIVYKEGDSFKKTLLRNTLKNIEQQLKPYSIFIRCHRIAIVNIHYVESLDRNYSNNWLNIKGYDEQIPVSRQYLLKIKEML